MKYLFICLFFFSQFCLADAVVVFNEIMYHPAENEAALEWLELHNQMAVNIDLSGWRLSSGIDFTFPTGTIISGGNYIVVAIDPAALKTAAGLDDSKVVGPFSGRLSNSGEQINLRDNSDRLMDSIAYYDGGKWSVGADGSGSSLAKINPDTASSPSKNWVCSSLTGGTPGEKNSFSHSISVAFNELSSVTNPTSFIELYNYGTGPAQLENFKIVSSGTNIFYTFPSTEIAAGEYLNLNNSVLGFKPAKDDKLFLWAADGKELLDAFAAKNKPRGRFPVGTGEWLYPDSETPGTSNTFSFNKDIVINEIMYHHRDLAATNGTENIPATEEWIELFNRGLSSVDLSDWKIKEAVDFTFPTNTILNPGEYIVVANDSASMQSQYPSIRIVGNFSGKLSNKDEIIELIDSNENPVDDVHYYDGFPWSVYADGNGASLELINPCADNSMPEAWKPSDESLKSSWSNYTYRGIADSAVRPTNWNEFVMGLLDAGEVLVDDIEVIEDPDGAATFFLQNGNFSSGSDKWRIIGNHKNSEVIIDTGDNVLKLVADGPTEHMHNHAETTFVSDNFVKSGLEYEISFRAKWFAGNNLLNTRLYFNRLPKTTCLNVPELNGTPGAQNSTYIINPGPAFSDFIHSPAVPAADQSVTVSAKVSDSDGISSCILFFSVYEGPWNSIPMNLINGTYSAQIPGANNSASNIVQFYVQAIDALNVTSAYPVTAADSPALYKVEDGLVSSLPVHHIRIIMNTSVVERMFLSEERMDNSGRPATVIYDEKDVFYNVGVRLKGSGYGRETEKAGYKLFFPADSPFRGVHSSVALDKSGRHMGGFDTSGSQEEIVSKHIANRAGGIPMPNDDLAFMIEPRLGRSHSVILTMARFGSDYLDGQWANGSDGKLFKFETIYFSTNTIDGNPESFKQQPATTLAAPTNKGGYATLIDIENLGDDKEFYRWHFLTRNKRNNDDYCKLVEMCKTFDLTGAPLEETIDDILDENEVMRVFAFYSLIGVFDTYNFGGNHNNMYYVRPEDNKVLAFPIDMDWAYGPFAWLRTAPLWSTRDDNNLSHIIEIPRNARRLYGHFQDIIQSTYNVEYIKPWLEHYYSLVENQPGHFTNLLSFVSDRIKSVLEQLPEQVPFEITSNNGEDFSTSELSVDIQGTAWIDIDKIYLEGNRVPLSPEWNTITNWNINVGLMPGTNKLNFIGYDFQGQTVVSDSITIVSSGTSEIPKLIINELMAINDTTITDAFGGYGDWVEIYNYGDKTESLKNCFLTDDFLEKNKWPFPDIFSASNSYSLVWADGDTNQGMMHANFKLSGSGEQLALYYKTNNIYFLLDSIVFGPQAPDVSFGRFPNAYGEFITMNSTPLAANIPEPCYLLFIICQMLFLPRVCRGGGS